MRGSAALANQQIARAANAAHLGRSKAMGQAARSPARWLQICQAGLCRTVLCRLPVSRSKVIVEVDGGTHGTEPETARDRARSTNLAALGYRMFRVRNRDVFDNMDRVLDALLAFVEGGD